MELHRIVSDFARAMAIVDGSQPAGIGPVSVEETTGLIMATAAPWDGYGDFSQGVPHGPRGDRRCDLCIGPDPDWDWAIGVRMVRSVDGEGRHLDALSSILSPWPAHRGALTAVAELVDSGLAGRKAILLYAYDHDTYPMKPLIESFEALGRHWFKLGDRCDAAVGRLQHPVYNRAGVYGWEVLGRN